MDSQNLDFDLDDLVDLDEIGLPDLDTSEQDIQCYENNLRSQLFYGSTMEEIMREAEIAEEELWAQRQEELIKSSQRINFPPAQG